MSYASLISYYTAQAWASNSASASVCATQWPKHTQPQTLTLIEIHTHSRAHTQTHLHTHACARPASRIIYFLFCIMQPIICAFIRQRDRQTQIERDWLRERERQRQKQREGEGEGEGERETDRQAICNVLFGSRRALNCGHRLLPQSLLPRSRPSFSLFFLCPPQSFPPPLSFCNGLLASPINWRRFYNCKT